MVTNFHHIFLANDRFAIQRISYDEHTLQALRSTHNRDASFFWHDDFIYISPRKGANLSIGELVGVDAVQSPKIALSLIRHLIFRAFREAFPMRVPKTFCPLKFYSERREHEPLSQHLPIELKGKIGYPRVMEVEPRQIEQDGRPHFGLLVGSRQRWRCRLDLEELHRDGFDLRGRTVLESVPIPGLEHVLAPDENLLGELLFIQGDTAILQTNSGKITRKLSTLHLQRTRRQIGDLLAHKIGTQKAEYLLRIADKDRKQREQID